MSSASLLFISLSLSVLLCYLPRCHERTPSTLIASIFLKIFKKKKINETPGCLSFSLPLSFFLSRQQFFFKKTFSTASGTLWFLFLFLRYIAPCHTARKMTQLKHKKCDKNRQRIKIDDGKKWWTKKQAIYLPWHLHTHKSAGLIPHRLDALLL